MALKERWGRMLRKSISSNSSSGNDAAIPKPTPAAQQQQPPPTPAAAAAGGAELSKAPSRLAKTLTWRSTKSTAPATAGDSSAAAQEKKQKKKSTKPKKPGKPLHPSERPLTEANLRHQELLGAFAMTFGRRRSSQGGRTSFSNVSPMGSRQASVDHGYHPHHHHHPHGPSHLGDRRVSNIPPDVAEEGSQQTT